MDRIDTIREKLEDALSPLHLEIIDESHHHAGHAGAASGAGHFNVTIVSGQFSEQSPIARHRLVYLAVDALMPAEIHALSIKALTPEEFESTKD
ncbi:MAG: BolA/IbaG family iron-sulfur metabolism protein [Gammaproteobacteria bacterium]|nr:BolA/IbaG family iron-sulfur metabolism protein [Gammaproteobacteria bacterium]